MKIPGLFKLLNLIAPLFILNLSVFGQNSFLKPDSKKDSAWVQQSLLNANRELITNKDTNRVIHTWVSGKVLYCSDGTLKAAQLIAAPDTFSATIQYCNHNKIFEQHFDYTDLSNYTLNSIYRLPDKAPSYLFLLSKTENQPDYEIWIKGTNQLDSLFITTNVKGKLKLDGIGKYKNFLCVSNSVEILTRADLYNRLSIVSYPETQK